MKPSEMLILLALTVAAATPVSLAFLWTGWTLWCSWKWRDDPPFALKLAAVGLIFGVVAVMLVPSWWDIVSQLWGFNRGGKA